MFDESENGPFEVPPGLTKIYTFKKVPDAPKLYVLHKKKDSCVLSSFLSELFFIGDKIAVDCLKDEITPSLKSNERLKFAQDVALNNVREKVKPQCKLSYKVLKEEYGYYPLLDIYPYITSIQLEDF